MLEWVRSQLEGRDLEIDTPFGRRRLTYADYVASGRSLAFIEEHMRTHVLPYYANTHTEDSTTGARTTGFCHEATAYVKRCLGADDSFKLIFCGTGSTGAIKRLQEILGIAIPGMLRERVLSVTPPAERPVVFVGPYEHHSNEVTWRETLAEVIEVPLADGRLDMDALRALLSDPRFAGRRLIGSFSAASNVTGLLTDTRAIARLLHEHGGWAFFDFAASAPYVGIDVHPSDEERYDAIFISPHKFVGGPGTPGVLLFHQDLYNLATPTTAGGGTVDYVSPWGHHYRADIETREDAGTPAILQKMRTALAFWVKEQVGVETIQAREHDLVTRALARLSRHPRIEILGPLDAPRLAVVSFLIRDDGRFLHPRFVVRLLNDLFGIQCRGGCACAGPYGHALLRIGPEQSHSYMETILCGWEAVKPGWTRLSFNYFLRDDEFEFLLDAIEFVADQGTLFLPLYTLDWHSGTWAHADEPPHPSLFAASQTHPRAAGPAPYARYLDEARALAATLRRTPRVPPPEVPPELVFFPY